MSLFSVTAIYFAALALGGLMTAFAAASASWGLMIAGCVLIFAAIVFDLTTHRCPRCRAYIRSRYAQFCPHCGAELEGEDQAESGREE